MLRHRAYPRCCLFVSTLTLISASFVQAQEAYVFDASLLRGSGLNKVDIEQLNQDSMIKPGSYTLDLYVNGTLAARDDIVFTAVEHRVMPCFSWGTLKKIGLKSLPEEPGEGCYRPDNALFSSITVSSVMSQMRVDFSVPQTLLDKLPRGGIREESLESGESMLFLNYMANQYHVTQKQDGGGTTDSTYLNLNGGLNLGLWRYRQQSALNYDSDLGSHWTTTRRYVQRAIVPLRSEMMIGEGYTDGRFFSGISFRGVQLTSDTRMRPESQRGYAPVVRGIARTNAKVTIRQGNNTLYETTVAPGAFAIDDLYPTNYAGDLNVIVTEADGSESTFNVPFSALAESMRAGFSEYSATVGRVRDVGNNDEFSEIVWQHGVTNALTINAGNQLANGYQAFMLGGVYSSTLGAWGMDSTFSRARLNSDDYQTGWMSRLNYSKHFPQTGTSVALAGYRYSTGGYAELYDVLGSRAAHNEEWQSSTWRQRSRVELSASQALDWLGNINLSFSSQDYRDQKSRDKQLQASWSKAFAYGISVNLTAARTRRITPSSQNGMGNAVDWSDAWQAKTQTLWSLSFSVPLGQSRYSPMLSISANHSDDDGGDYQSTLSGVMGERDPLSYSLNYATNDRGEQSVWGANFQKNFPWVSGGASWSSSSDYWQASASLQGALVLHRGGITPGPYLGDTFALIEAPGADGARISGGQGAQVNAFGYALAPSLVPYQFNTVSLDPQDMADDVELQTSVQRVAPFAGAMVRLRYTTLQGQAMLITAQRLKGEVIPMGAAVYDEYDNSIGMMGQASQLYFRASDEKGILRIKWGEAQQESCRIAWQNTQPSEPLRVLTLPCR
ncbi:fimbria/pilus outer membrane usher protein [Enterobacter hormaechei]|uniref:fimbria/pilus outer membrane usher protein n=1 Tax=Enterobacter hormaechei TaxID=158836 RepID=UPI003C2F27CB